MSTAWEAVKSSTEKTSRLSTPENPVFQRGCITSSTNSGGMSRSDLWSRGRGPNRRDRFLSASFPGAFCWPCGFAASASLPRGSRPCRWMTRTRGSHAASTGAGIAAVLPDMPHIKAAGVWRARKPAIPERGGVGLKVFHGEAFRRGQTRRDFQQGFGGPLLLFGGRFPPCPMQ